MTLRKDLMWTKTHNTARGTGTEEGCGTATKAITASEPVACGYRTSGVWIPNQLIQAPQRLLQESFYGIRQSVSDQADTAIA